MEYYELYRDLKRKVKDNDFSVIDGQTHFYTLDFTSHSTQILPGGKAYNSSSDFETPNVNKSELLTIADADIHENHTFRYHVFQPAGVAKSKQMILLLHGLNEKSWDKYYPWAKRLSELTGKTIVLFPIAFHMNRAPQAWSDRHLMYATSRQRQQAFPQVMHSTLSNVATSTRLHIRPQRFFWSGIQTYYDIIQLVEQIKSDAHPLIEKDAAIDFFAYSIGCLLSEILIMTNQNNYFEQSRLFMFCGGPVFNRMSPVSKFILDSEANVALYSFVVEHLEHHLMHDSHLRQCLCETPEGINFRSMLSYGKMMHQREEMLARISQRIMAVALANDTVIPPYEVENTLLGSMRQIPVKIEIIDFPYPYKHEDPFPDMEPIAQKVTQAFHRVFETASRFLTHSAQ